MKHSRVYWLTCILALAMALGASATTIVLPTDAQLVQKSPLIVRGTVLSSTPVDRNGTIWTETVLHVEQVLKGEAPSSVTVGELGGILNDHITKVFGAPQYAVGERVLVFLTPTPRGDYQTTDLFVGKFSEAQMLNGERIWRRDDGGDHVSVLDHDFRPLDLGNVQRLAPGFEEFIAGTVSGRPAESGYEVVNPALVMPSEAPGGRLEPTPDFALISEPDVYRWFAFENGQTAQWYSQGTQPGYSGGGVNEIRTAMAVWTGYSSALIRYNYAGTFNGTAAGLTRPNGTNEVLFNDPLGEIAGTWNPSTGGVVGQGGFNGVSAARSWSSPFAADASHPQRTYSAWNITEGNLTVQDGVSPSANISSSSLAEIVAHEFGHTLGLGHSADSNALMYYMVRGLGPSLRADDQLAARWLYPNGSVAPPPTVTAPAAPSGLTGSASGSSVTLQWSDNSSNESGFSIYYAGATGSFIKAGDVAAGARSAVVNGLGAATWRFYVTAFNSGGESSPSNTVTLVVGTQPLAAAFSFTPATGTAGVTTFTFTDQSTGSIASRSWNFGDGTTGSGASVTHLYATAGAFNVLLVVVDTSGAQAQLTRSVTVTSAPAPLSAAFTYSPASPVAGSAVSFADQSTGGVTSWSWAFGDGGSSSQQNPTHTYASQGSYNVVLTAYRGSESRVSSKTLAVGASAPVTPSNPTFHALVPASAQTNGAGGSVWRTELTLFNAGGETANVALTFVPGAGVAPQSRSLILAARQSRTYANALLDIFGISVGAGAISVEATGTASLPQLKVTSRTFDETGSGTYGQGVPSVATGDMPRTAYLTGIISTTEFRTNIGLVNRSTATASATLTLVDDAGNNVAGATIALPAGNFQQRSLAEYFPAVNGRSYPLLSLRVDADVADAVSAYASVIDNRTQDPVYIQALPLPAASSIVVPVVGRAPGANNTFWRSDVTIYNPSTSWSTVTMTLRAATTATSTVSIGPRQSLLVTDVLEALGLTSGSGSLKLTWSGSSSLVVSSRTYTTATGGGTFGQSVDAVAAFAREQYVPGLRSDAAFRSNIGFVNGGADPVSVAVTLYSAGGTVLGSATVPVGGNAQVQDSIAHLFPALNAQTIGTFTLKASASGPAFAYGSIVDNITGDPVFYGGK